MPPEWRWSPDPTDPPDGYTVHHAVVMDRGHERVLLLCQVGREVALVTGVDVAELVPGTVVLVSIRTDRWADVERDGQRQPCAVLLAGAWQTATVEWIRKRKPTLVLPTS